MKYEYSVVNLECGNCAKKIENALNSHHYFKNAIVNFNTSKLIYESDYENHKEEAIKIIKSLEPDVELKALNIKNDFKIDKKTFLSIIIGLIIGGLSLLFDNFIGTILILLSYILLLTRVFIKAIKILFKSHTLDENMLITISVVGAFLIDQPFEGFMVIGLYSIGKLLEEMAVNKSKRNVSSLMDIRPEYANVLEDGKIVIKNPSEVKINDILVIKVGEKVPLDGVIINGTTHLDTVALTGESKPIDKITGDNVLSGSVNLTNKFELKVTSTYENSTVYRILDLVENATNRKAKTENFVSKAAKIYTPIIIVLALATGTILPLFGISTSEAIYRALSFLVISCPCAIAISVPLSYFSGIGVASKKGILIKGSDYLDNLRNVKTMIFDKTGTLTTGKFNVVEVASIDNRVSLDEILFLTALGESLSNHPLAKTIVKYYGKEIDSSLVINYQEIAGKGITFEYKNKKYSIGNSTFVGNNVKDTKTTIYLKMEDKVIGKIVFDDILKDKTVDTIKRLKQLNIHTIMLTGDNQIIAKEVAALCKIDECYAELLPQDKYKMVENQIQKKDGVVCFVGDGINDAPVLTLADIGISMGQIGSNSAIEASDIVIMTDELDKIIEGIEVSKYTTKIIKQNLIFSIGTKLIFIVLNLFGFSTMALAVFADVGVTVLAILNSIRILKR